MSLAAGAAAVLVAGAERAMGVAREEAAAPEARQRECRVGREAAAVEKARVAVDRARAAAAKVRVAEAKVMAAAARARATAGRRRS